MHGSREAFRRSIFTSLAVAALAAALMAGCSANSSEPIDDASPEPAPTSQPPSTTYDKRPALEVLNDDMQQIYANRDTGLPVAVKYMVAGEGGITVYPAYGEDAVNQTLDAIADIVVVGETDMVAEDNSTGYIFIAEDGSTVGVVSFNMGNLEAGGKIYVVENTGGLSTLPFPAAFQREDIWSVIPDPTLLEFLTRCDAGEGIQSATVTMAEGGESKTSTSQEDIINLASALIYADITYAGEADGSATNAFDVTFTMDDGTEFTFRFANGSYIYEFPEPIGAWEYYCSSFKELPNIIK